ncbi:MAG: HNH endonuclease, partial [Shimia sp.]|nr:HNH endonuclease [Shimia sp.]
LDEDDSTHTEVRELGDSLKNRIDEVREEFTGPQDVQGFINTPNTVFSKLGEGFGLTSYWGAATPAQMMHLENGEEIHMHHLIPRASGGSNADTNLRLMHQLCHQQIHSNSAPATVSKLLEPDAA